MCAVTKRASHSDKWQQKRREKKNATYIRDAACKIEVRSSLTD